MNRDFNLVKIPSSILADSISINSSSIYRDHFFDHRRHTRATSTISSSGSESCEPATLSELERILFTTALQDCSDKLYLLLHVYPFDEKKMPRSFTYTSLQNRMEAVKKFEVKREVVSYEDKFQKDLYTCYFLITRCQNEIWRHSNYATFSNRLDNLDNTMKDEENLRLQYARNVASIQELKESIVQEKKQFEEEIANIKKETRVMESDLSYAKAVKYTEMKYIQQWEKTRQSQNQQLLSASCNDYLQIIESTRRKIEQENIAHSEIERFMQGQYEEYVKSVDTWSAAYERDLERMDMEITTIKGKRELLAQHFQSLQKEYEDRKVEIDEWVAYKEKRRKEEEERLRQEKAATKIQAWWRGVMVRRCLGRYRKKKGKGKGKKGKGGKGKGGNVKSGKAKAKK